MQRIALCSLGLLLISAQASALCRDDLQDLAPRIDRVKKIDPQRYQLSLHWWGKAFAIEKVSELQCRTFLVRAQKALTQPIGIGGCDRADEQAPHCAIDGRPAPGG